MMNYDMYHVHLTIPKCLSEPPHGWKSTSIVFGDDTRTQTDTMITKHYVVGIKGTTVESMQDDCQHMAKLLGAVRIKIEKDNNFGKLSPEHYLECHCKVRGPATFNDQWVRSKNPKDIQDGVEIYFWNKRVREGHPYMEVFAIEREIRESGCTVVDLKFEQIYSDSDMSRDSWWA